MNRKTLWLSLILIIGACLSIVLMLSRDGTPNYKEHKTGGMNAFMTHAVYRQFNTLGYIHSQIITPNMEHYAKKDTSFFVKPKILVYTQLRIPWHIHSDYGRSIEGTHTVYLWGHVVLHQPQMIDHPETTIFTTSMTIYPKRSFAKTDQNVTIHRPGSVVTGKGVTANFKTGIIKLLTHSQGLYEPSNKDEP